MRKGQRIDRRFNYYYGKNMHNTCIIAYAVLQNGCQVDMIYNNVTGEVDRRLIKGNSNLFFRVAGSPMFNL